MQLRIIGWACSLALLTACGGGGSDSGSETSSITSQIASSSVSSLVVSSSSLLSSSLISNNQTTSSTLSAPSSLSTSSRPSSSSSSSTVTNNSSRSSSAAAEVPQPDLSADPSLPAPLSPNYSAAKDASRFLAQATFGATPKAIDRVITLGKEAWLEEQFNLPQTRHLTLLDQRFQSLGWVAAPEVEDSADGYIRDLQRSDIWWEVALWSNDQLRQRVAYSLSQILVISNVSDVLYNDTRGIANYQDILATHAFGNYRDLLKAITLNPMMGEYLSMVRNEKSNAERNIRPDENYARELMQLFSIGLVQLNLDGSVKLDDDGNPIPTYDQTTVKELARVFTGWNMATAAHWWDWKESGASEVLPMKSFSDFHDFGQKTLFGDQIIAAGNTPEQDIDAALDIIFAHPNIGPFISKQIIQRLVTSNPSPGYVTRVASVFNNNGQGVKGDMKAVISAVLLDAEAQTGHETSPNMFGKLREPLLKTSHLWRAFKATGTPTQLENSMVTPPRIRFWGSSRVFGQRPFGSFSVFNFYRPDYQHPGALKNNNMISPEFQILTESMAMSGMDFMSGSIFYRDSPHDWLEPTIGGTWDVFPPRLHLDAEKNLANTPAQLLDRLNLLLMAGQMSEPMRELIVTHLENHPINPDWDAAGQAWLRDVLVYEALFLVMASPEYAVQR